MSALIDLKCDTCARVCKDWNARYDGQPCHAAQPEVTHETPCQGTLKRIWSRTRTAAVPPSGRYSYGA